MSFEVMKTNDELEKFMSNWEELLTTKENDEPALPPLPPPSVGPPSRKRKAKTDGEKKKKNDGEKKKKFKMAEAPQPTPIVDEVSRDELKFTMLGNNFSKDKFIHYQRVTKEGSLVESQTFLASKFVTFLNDFLKRDPSKYDDYVQKIVAVLNQ